MCKCGELPVVGIETIQLEGRYGTKHPSSWKVWGYGNPKSLPLFRSYLYFSMYLKSGLSQDSVALIDNPDFPWTYHDTVDKFAGGGCI